jgi:aspartyl-tRNA(Asn)/glutamyl-tRNA(Gln) amidotransferase subunit B
MSVTYKPTIGLEIHAELKTQTKMFCDCLNDASEKHPNVNICSICTGQPGALPTINKQAVEHVLKVGLALGGEVFADKESKFDRKNYFYPDLPKGYQVSQYDQPLVTGGELNKIRLIRIHLEEDAGRLSHSKEDSLVDYNRAGVPLMELVTEPDIKSSAEAASFAKELQLLLRYLGVSDADMEKGHMRLEANISLNMGTKVEVKNINSFKAMEDAIKYELARQEKLLKANKKVSHETRGWNDVKKVTVSQRSKEEAQEYRYFPEPDLPPFDEKSFNIKSIKADVPELPQNKRERFKKEYSLTSKQADVLVQNMAAAGYFEEAASELGDVKKTNLLFNYFTSDVWGLMKKRSVDINGLNISPAHLAHVIELVADKRITSRIAKNLLLKMHETSLDPSEIIANEEWEQVSDESSLKPLAKQIIKDHPQPVADYKKGKSQSIQFLIGMAMSELGGKADPNVLKGIFEELLKD